MKATAVNKDCLVQGRRGTNPLKVKTKVAKSGKLASSSLKECDVALVKGHEEKPAWVLESCLRGKSGPKVTLGQGKSTGGMRLVLKTFYLTSVSFNN